MPRDDDIPNLLQTVRLAPCRDVWALPGEFTLSTLDGRELAAIVPFPAGDYDVGGARPLPIGDGAWEVTVYDERGEEAGVHVLALCGDDAAEPALCPAAWAMLAVAWTVADRPRGRG